MTTKYIILPLFFLFLGIAGCDTKDAPAKEDPTETTTSDENIISLTREQYAHSGIVLGILQKESIYETITTTGFLNVPQENRVIISSYMGGYISATPLLPGDYVKKGQFLLSLSNPEIITLEQDYLIAKQSLTYLKTVYERQQILSEEKISSKDTFLAAEMEYFNMLASCKSLEQRLILNQINPKRLSTENISPIVSLYSPIDGVLVRVEAVQGQMAPPGQELFEIVNTDHFHLEMKVFERDAATIKAGQKLKFIIPDTPYGVYTGEVFLVGKAINRNDRTVDIHAHINKNQTLPNLYGLFVEADIISDEREGICVPGDALVDSDGKHYLLVKINETEDQIDFERIVVNTGFMTDTYTEILPPGPSMIGNRQFIVKGAYGLIPD